jgi:hypothetical protein
MDGKPSSESVQLVAGTICPQFAANANYVIFQWLIWFGVNSIAPPSFDRRAFATVGGSADVAVDEIRLEPLADCRRSIRAHANQPDAAVGQGFECRYADLPSLALMTSLVRAHLEIDDPAHWERPAREWRRCLKSMANISCA